MVYIYKQEHKLKLLGSMQRSHERDQIQVSDPSNIANTTSHWM